MAGDPRTTPLRVEPTEDGERLRIAWADSHTSEYKPRDLRLACRCAACIEETTGRPILDPGRVPASVYPLEIRYVGRYALHFSWSDGHATGIYPFELLRSICPCPDCTRT
jgi:ATP-binding protein involved in chromosome partitioning